MDKKELYAEYEKLLLGKKRNLPSSFWDQNPTISYQNALTIIQYAVEKLLKWTPSDVANALTLKTMHMMKLHTLLKYLNVPVWDTFVEEGRVFEQQDASVSYDHMHRLNVFFTTNLESKELKSAFHLCFAINFSFPPSRICIRDLPHLKGKKLWQNIIF